MRDNADVLRHIIKNVSSRLVGIIQSPRPVPKVLPLVKSGVWGCVQSRAQWSTEEDTHMRRPGHHWICEFGDAGNGTSCERQFNLDHRKCEDYRDTRFYNKDSTLVIKRWLNRVEEARMRQDSRSKSGRRTLTHHGHLWLC